MNPKLAATLLCLCASCWAQEAPTAAAPPAAPESAVHAPALAASGVEPVEPREPDVHHTVIEDDGSRIEELRVRGVTQRITVTPKVGKADVKSYEIITSDGSRDLGPGANTSRGAAGKRVWNIFQF